MRKNERPDPLQIKFLHQKVNFALREKIGEKKIATQKDDCFLRIIQLAHTLRNQRYAAKGSPSANR